jgi:hypothetical protein
MPNPELLIRSRLLLLVIALVIVGWARAATT